MLFGNGTTQTLSYDVRYRLSSNRLTTAGETIAWYDYGHDPASNITRIDDLTNAGYNRAFVYDDLHRLVATSTGMELWRASSYAYDAMGNPLTMIQGVENEAPEPMGSRRTPVAQNVLKRTTGFTYAGTTPKIESVSEWGVSRPVSYDGAGNETGYVATRTYSPRNLLRSVSDWEETSVLPHRLEYGYDGRGVRISRKEGRKQLRVRAWGSN